jgi:hypothetical protein
VRVAGFSDAPASRSLAAGVWVLPTEESNTSFLFCPRFYLWQPVSRFKRDGYLKVLGSL